MNFSRMFAGVIAALAIVSGVQAQPIRQNGYGGPIVVSSITASNIDDNLIVTTGPDGLLVGVSSFTLTPAGNVGIGVAAPLRKLHVVGGGSGGDGVSAVYTNGTVGIGMTSPQNVIGLHVSSSTAQNNLIWFGSNSASQGNARYGNSSSDGTGSPEVQSYISNTSAGSAYLLNRLGGNVGIGLATPLYLLHVNGSVFTSSFTVQAVSYSTAPIYAASVTLDSTFSYIQAASTFSAAGTVIAITTVTLPSAAAAPFKEFAIFKVDGTTTPVTVAAASGQTIDGYPTIALCSKGMGVTLVSDAVNNWNVKGNYPVCENMTGQPNDSSAAAALVASDTYYSPFKLTAPCDLKHIKFTIGTQSGVYAFNIRRFNPSTGNLELILSTGTAGAAGITVPAAANGLTLELHDPAIQNNHTHLPAGQYYYGWGFDNATATITRWQSGEIGVLIDLTDANLLTPPANIHVASLNLVNSARSPSVKIGCWNGSN